MTKIGIVIGCFLLAGIISAELLLEEMFDTAPVQQYQWKETVPNSGKSVSKE